MTQNRPADSILCEEGVSPPVAVVGAGNWLISSDNIGPRVLEMVRDRYGPEVELCDVGSGGLALLDHLHGQELMLVVDACVGYGEPGEVMLVEPDLDQPPARECSVHQIGPIEALVVARHLAPATLPRCTRLVLVETAGIDEQAEDSACERVVAVLDREIERWRGSHSSSSESSSTDKPAGLPANGGMNGST